MLRIFAPCAIICLLASSLHAAERYAFLVGVRQYDKTQLNVLQFTENDVTRLAAVLQQAGYNKSNVVLMTQTVGATETRFLPIAKNIRKELDLMLREVKAGDSVLAAFSGHGVQFDEAGDSYFCPADANLEDRGTLIPLGDVYQSLQTSKATVKVLLVDACRNDPLSSLSRSRQVVNLETLSKQQGPEPPGGIAALFSCSRGEKSFEHPALKHGIFFNFVIQGLSGQADLDKDGEISLAELEQYAVKEVQRYARRELAVAQTPERRGEARGLLTLASASRAPLPVLPEEMRAGQTMTNSIGMKLVFVPVGAFQMGSTPADVQHMLQVDSSFQKQYADSELPSHSVRITRPFLMGGYEVTKGQFARFVQEQNYRTEAERTEGGFGMDRQGKREGPKPQYNWRNTGFSYEDNHPVVNVSWNDAVAFCKWLSGKEGRQYRLPTEAEWEYACRAGTTSLYSNGDDPANLTFVGNTAEPAAKSKSPGDGIKYTAPVGKFRANSFGLYDMHGNIEEWCADWYAESYYTSSPENDPLGPAAGQKRVVRGGSWEKPASHCRSATRMGRGDTARTCSTGFRVAVTLSE